MAVSWQPTARCRPAHNTGHMQLHATSPWKTEREQHQLAQVGCRTELLQELEGGRPQHFQFPKIWILPVQLQAISWLPMYFQLCCALPCTVGKLEARTRLRTSYNMPLPATRLQFLQTLLSFGSKVPSSLIFLRHRRSSSGGKLS